MNFNKILDNFSFYKDILIKAKKSKVVYFTPQSEETFFNFNKKVEGVSSVDITGYYSPSLMEYIRGNVNSYLEGVSLHLEGTRNNLFLKFLSLFKAFSFVNLSFNWNSWVWTIDTLDSLRYDIIREKFLNSSKKERTSANREELAKLVSREEIYKYVSTYYIRAFPNLWVSKNDPGVIIYNNYEDGKPFHLKDGWEFSQLEEILSEWCSYMTHDHIHAKVKR